jgi:hypothetical protein
MGLSCSQTSRRFRATPVIKRTCRLMCRGSKSKRLVPFADERTTTDHWTAEPGPTTVLIKASALAGFSSATM